MNRLHSMIIVITAAGLAACGDAAVESEPPVAPGGAVAEGMAAKPQSPVAIDYRIIGTPVVGQPVTIDLKVKSNVGDAPVTLSYGTNDSTAVGASRPRACREAVSTRDRSWLTSSRTRPAGRSRAMAARLLAGGKISPHVDSHPSFHRGHRIHVPITTNPRVRFMIDGRPHQFEVGYAYEINNQKSHSVMNKGKEDRITFIFDYVPPGPLAVQTA